MLLPTALPLSLVGQAVMPWHKDPGRRLRGTLLMAAVWTALLAMPASGSLVITATESGSNVVFSFTGSVNLTGAPAPVTAGFAQFINPGVPALSFQSASSQHEYQLPGKIWAAFGTGGSASPTSGSGDILYLTGSGGNGLIGLSTGYSSGDTISGSMTFASTDFTTLGITPGTYTWDLTFSGSGAVAQDITITAVPEPALLPATALLATVACLPWRLLKGRQR